LLARLPRVLVPWRCRIWFQVWSHKLLRLAVPWALLALFAVTALLPGPLYQTLFWAQVAGYSVGLLGALCPPLGRLQPVSAAASFVLLNAAAWVAFWVWLIGGTSRSWCPATYVSAAPPAAEVRGTAS
jgi:hypothetical protein